MLLLYHIHLIANRIPGADLHSTMLLLYRNPSHCIRPSRSHLHSTMLLLYLSRRDLPDTCVIIYIPLCFYFIASFSISVALPISDLHSTMLLLYPTVGVSCCSLSLFTFHYASTLSCPDVLYRKPCFRFTFHYASTLS